jgi:hypothetical protein
VNVVTRLQCQMEPIALEVRSRDMKWGNIEKIYVQTKD